MHKKHTELNKQLQVQLFGLREEHQTVLGHLKEAHSLLEKHVETSNKAQEGEVRYADRLPALLYLSSMNNYRDLLFNENVISVFSIYIHALCVHSVR